MEEKEQSKYSPPTTGRRQIFTSVKEITAENVVGVISKAVAAHNLNVGEIEKLYDYYKGKQDVYYRKKSIRPEINNKVCVNVANEIVSFKTGYLCGEPIQYIASCGEDRCAASVQTLNSYMDCEGKAAKDKEIVEWMFISGHGYRMVLPREHAGEDEAPYELYTLDPRSAFVIRSTDVGNKPVAGVYATVNEDGTERTFNVYTKDRFFVVKNNELVKEEVNPIGAIPIIEYAENNARLGAFETVISLLDAINTLESNRLDSVEQFVQSLLVLKNCSVNEGTTANDIRQAGMILLSSIGEQQADIDVIAEQLDQSQNQTLKDDLYFAIMHICGMPTQTDGNNYDSSNNGAVILRNGWQSAESRAKDTELMFKSAEREMLKVVLRIVRGVSDKDMKLSDVDFRFTRRQYDALLTKSQTLTTMLDSDKIHPRDAYNACGLFIDPEAAYQNGMEWYEAVKKAEQEAAEAAMGGGGAGGDDNDGKKGQHWVQGYYR